ncbi:hypothetical protein [Blastomonas fulva]|uniref:hypothetical protein n=1 Tax=Blastomonas fulva TaxID=1550728 RepID=UPI0025A3BB0A|nr:hypothetical protein [Blastomonas fulva]MDM7928694.1 hypothetical protein [Blastomonas fulva]MDM7964480.1 hypothetical protein [Blastomonas fulva]
MSFGPQEKTVLDLWDSGLTILQIVVQTGIKKENVGRILSSFDGSSDQRIDEASIRAGSQALLAAIQQVQA